MGVMILYRGMFSRRPNRLHPFTYGLSLPQNNTSYCTLIADFCGSNTLFGCP